VVPNPDAIRPDPLPDPRGGTGPSVVACCRNCRRCRCPCVRPTSPEDHRGTGVPCAPGRKTHWS